MIKSMTGYGSATYECEAFTASVVASSINHRFLEVQIRLPDQLLGMEKWIRKKIQECCQRGRVTVTVDFDPRGSEIINYELNHPLIIGVVSALRKAKEEFSLSGEIDINSLAVLHDIIRPARASSKMQAGIEQQVGAVVEHALAAMVEMRATEGQQLVHDLSARLDQISRWLEAIEAEAGSLTGHYRQKLLKRIEELRGDLQIDQSRLAQEVIFLASRADITEELVRLRSHVTQFRSLMDSSEAVGKKLDFLLQEMNREVNTILSKSNELKISQTALEIKGEIEKLREQVQNVE